MRFHLALLAGLSLAACFDFTDVAFGGAGARCGDLDHACRAGFTCASDNVCVVACEQCGELLPGDTCGSANDCKLGVCVEGVCCRTECDGICNSCDANRTGRGAGSCEPVLVNAPPGVGCNGAGCDGAGHCKLLQGSVCDDGAKCGNGHCVDGFCCDAACDGVCESCASTLTLVADGVCAATAAGLETDDECAGAVLCDGARGCTCQSAELCKQPKGGGCTSDAQCDTGHCMDGVCCDLKCDGLCEACVGTLTGAGAGFCLPVTSGRESADECVGTITCDGARHCFNKSFGATCSAANECLSGFCTDGHCCAGDCTGTCKHCDNAGQCVSVTSGSDPGTCDTGGQCGVANCACSASGACARANGQSCGDRASNCASDICDTVKSVCCEQVCHVSCESCVQPAAYGSCTPYPAGTSAQGQCGDGPDTCDGEGGCTKSGGGGVCQNNNGCMSGHCRPTPNANAIGMCCDVGCSGTCYSCDTNFTGMPAGQCGPVIAGHIAENGSCSCSGSGSCQ